jgi:hypothetical protein
MLIDLYELTDNLDAFGCSVRDAPRRIMLNSFDFRFLLKLRPCKTAAGVSAFRQAQIRAVCPQRGRIAVFSRAFQADHSGHDMKSADACQSAIGVQN